MNKLLIYFFLILFFDFCVFGDNSASGSIDRGYYPPEFLQKNLPIRDVPLRLFGMIPFF